MVGVLKFMCWMKGVVGVVLELGWLLLFLIVFLLMEFELELVDMFFFCRLKEGEVFCCVLDSLSVVIDKCCWLLLVVVLLVVLLFCWKRLDMVVCVIELWCWWLGCLLLGMVLFLLLLEDIVLVVEFVFYKVIWMWWFGWVFVVFEM